DRSRNRAPDGNPGAIYRVRVDNTHPLAFGFGDDSFVLRQGTRPPEVMTGSGNWNVGFIQEDGRVSGHTGYRAESRIEGSLAFGVQSDGSGEWVFLPDNPLFRGFWQSGLQLFANAVFMARQ
ncbi:MAG: zinc carboxypeptidase, partial [Bacteroidetes bacterium]|nr:zinc carboxypeptidase [Bacteroidota bacterium]